MTHTKVFSNGEFESFKFPKTGQTVGAILVGTDPWFFLDDACQILAVRTRDAMSGLPNDEKMRDSVAGTLRDLVSESGLYRLIFKSRKPEAEAFKTWVVRDVLPAIRRTGVYQFTTQHVEVEEFYQPHTLTWDETRALIRQRYGIPMSVNDLTRTLRTAGVLKQNGTPRKDWEHLFWFTGSSWNVHPHMVAQLTKKIVDTGRELQQFRFLQAQLELEGVGSPALLQSERPIPRQRNISPRPAAREDVQDRPDDNRP